MKNNIKLAVVGASGGIGQPLALLLKCSSVFKAITLIDVEGCVNPVSGVATDLGHINTETHVSAYTSPDGLRDGLTSADIVLITAGCMALKPGMSRDSLFDSSASLISSLAEVCAEVCPKAFIAIVTNPVNSMVPLFVERLRSKGLASPEGRVFGVTTLDVVRASTFVAHECGLDPKMVDVPVIGGHGGESILTLVSQASPKITLSSERMEALEKRINSAAFEIIAAKGNSGSATLSMAYAASRFCHALAEARTGTLVKEYAYANVKSIGPVPGIDASDEYFAGHCSFNSEGLVSMDAIPVSSLTSYETSRLAEARTKCQQDVRKAYEYISTH